MFESAILPVKTALEENFGSVRDLYAELNMPEHRHETLCFAGIESYTVSGAVYGGESGSVKSAEVKYLVQLLGKRGCGAKELFDLADSGVIPALNACPAAVKEIKHSGCKYSKEQQGYIASVTLTFKVSEETSIQPENVGFTLGGVLYPCMNRFEVSSEVKTAETPLLGGSIKTRKIGKRARTLTLSGETNSIGGSAVYGLLSPSLGEAVPEISVGGIAFSGMTMTGLTLSGGAEGVYKIEAEFKEVDE